MLQSHLDWWLLGVKPLSNQAHPDVKSLLRLKINPMLKSHIGLWLSCVKPLLI